MNPTPANIIDSWHLTKHSFKFMNENHDLNLFMGLQLLLSAIFISGSYQLLVPISSFKSLEFFMVLMTYCLFIGFTMFLRSALLSITLKRLSHEPHSILAGVKAASKRLAKIILWGIFIALFGPILNLVEQCAVLLNKLFNTNFKFNWHAYHFYVLPILTIENLSIKQAMQASRRMVGQDYRNTANAKVPMSIFTIICLLSVIHFVINPTHTSIQISLYIIPFLLFVYILTSSLDLIIKSALYLNFKLLRTPKHFDPTILARAFEKRN